MPFCPNMSYLPQQAGERTGLPFSLNPFYSKNIVNKHAKSPVLISDIMETITLWD